MKLFDTFEAVKFPEEDMIFITRGGYLYYIYNPKYKWWRKHSNQVFYILYNYSKQILSYICNRLRITVSGIMNFV